MKNILYHGSKFDNQGKPLIPGYYHSGEETFWDGGFESNRYLYATSEVTSAVLLGIGSIAEKDIGTVGFKFDESNPREAIFLFEKNDLITPEELEKKLKTVSVYLYTIKMLPSHGWLDNNNPVNEIKTEYKTNNAIPKRDYLCSEIKVLEWLKKKNIEIKTVIR